MAVDRFDLSAAEAGIPWRHLDEWHADDVAWLRQVGLPPVAIDALLAEETRPRFAAFGGGDVVILRGVNLNEGGEPEDMVALRCWLSAERVITVARRHVRSVSEVRDRLSGEERCDDAGGLLVLLAQALTAKIRGMVRAMEDAADDYEDELLRAPESDLRDRLQELRGRAIGLHRYVTPQHEALIDVLEEPPGWLSDSDAERLREVADQTRRAVETLSTIREAIGALQQQISMRQAERMNRTSYLLTVIAGLFLPLNLIAAMLGANVGGIPGAQTPDAFWWMSGLFVVLTVVGFLVLRWFGRL